MKKINTVSENTAITKAATKIGLKFTSTQLASIKKGEIIHLHKSKLIEAVKILAKVDKHISNNGGNTLITKMISSNVTTSQCSGHKVVQVNDKCWIYYHFPIGFSYCCEV